MGMFFYVACIPILFASLLWYYRKQVNQPWVRYWMGNLYYCYKPRFFWFEMVVILRRLLLAAIISSLPGTTEYKAAALVAVLVVSLTLQAWIRPFNTLMDNRMEELALSVTIFTYGCQLS